MLIVLRVRSKKSSNAPTKLLELVAILLVLTLLVTAALPRFMRTKADAEAARMETLAGSLRSSISLFHSTWRLAGGDGAQINLSNHGLGQLDANATGFPVSQASDVASVSRDRHCQEIWLNLLASPPSVANANPNQEAGTSIHHIEPKLGTEIEFVAGQDPVINDAGIAINFANNAQVCQFISLSAQSVASGAAKPTIYYDSLTGAVVLDLDRVF